MPDKIFLDTNILVYLANEDSPFHLRSAEKFKEVAGKSELWIRGIGLTTVCIWYHFEYTSFLTIYTFMIQFD